MPFVFAVIIGVFLLSDLEKSISIVPEGGNILALNESLLLPQSDVLPADDTAFSAEGTPKQKPLSDPPELVKAVYITSWTAGTASRLNSILNLIDRDEDLNAVVIDIKDYSGYLAYSADIPETKKSGAENNLRISDINGIIKLFHDKNIYVIGRISVFQDPVLAKYRPELAVQSSAGGVWKDNKGLLWLDPGAKQVWDYNLAIARDALDRGFDEINFDYIRFPSDGNLDTAVYTFSGGNKSARETIRNFFKYLRENLREAKISADIFGLATVAEDDLGIGQMIEDAYEYFDYVAPMVYPSHYASGFIGYKNPAAYPYEVVKYSLENALLKRQALISSFSSSSSKTVVDSLSVGKLRPWLQVFDLGAVYDRKMVEAQIRAVDETLNNAAASQTSVGSDKEAVGAGWMLWDPKNTYEGYIQ